MQEHVFLLAGGTRSTTYPDSTKLHQKSKNGLDEWFLFKDQCARVDKWKSEFEKHEDFINQRK